MPPMRSVRPSMPPLNATVLRSGSLRSDSPAQAAEDPSRTKRAAAAQATACARTAPGRRERFPDIFRCASFKLEGVGTAEPPGDIEGSEGLAACVRNSPLGPLEGPRLA